MDRLASDVYACMRIEDAYTFFDRRSLPHSRLRRDFQPVSLSPGRGEGTLSSSPLRGED
jgi:hypothetical protein